jgi:hypothetical protein
MPSLDTGGPRAPPPAAPLRGGVYNLYFGDNLDVLKQKIKDESVDLVYLDPNSIPTLIITCCSGHLGARG